MKNLLVYVLCTVFLLVGCQGVEKVVEDKGVDTSSEEITIYSDSMFLTNEQEISKFIELYEDALKVYRWFNYSTMELDYERPIQSNQAEHQHLYEIKDNTFSTMNDLRNYVSNYFSKELVDELMENQQLYKEIDGKLYGTAADRGSDITKGDREVYKVIKLDEQKYMFRVEVDVVHPENRLNVIEIEVVDFPMEKINDNYVFTEFKAIR